MRRMETAIQTVATHSPADGVSEQGLLRLTKYGPEPVNVKETDTIRSCGSSATSAGFVEAAIEE